MSEYGVYRACAVSLGCYSMLIWLYSKLGSVYNPGALSYVWYACVYMLITLNSLENKSNIISIKDEQEA